MIQGPLPALKKPSKAEMKEWSKWVLERPLVVRSLCEKFPPWKYYDMPKTGQIVVVESWSEDGTMRVLVVGDRISVPTIVPFEVFGVSRTDLVKSKYDKFLAS